MPVISVFNNDAKNALGSNGDDDHRSGEYQGGEDDHRSGEFLEHEPGVCLGSPWSLRQLG